MTIAKEPSVKKDLEEEKKTKKAAAGKTKTASRESKNVLPSGDKQRKRKKFPL
jgi:hypothetical protein